MNDTTVTINHTITTIHSIISTVNDTTTTVKYVIHTFNHTSETLSDISSKIQRHLDNHSRLHIIAITDISTTT